MEFAFSAPAKEKIRNGVTKFILRDAMAGILPEPVRARMDKIGFSTPEDIWFCTAMKGFIQDLIASDSFHRRPYFNVGQVEKLVEAHLRGEQNMSSMIWRIINLEIWLRLYVD